MLANIYKQQHTIKQNLFFFYFKISGEATVLSVLPVFEFAWILNFEMKMVRFRWHVEFHLMGHKFISKNKDEI